jgi:Putative addiction module component
MNKPNDAPLDDLAPEPPITDAVRAEVLRRRTTYEQDKKTARPWSEVYAELRQKLAGPR